MTPRPLQLEFAPHPRRLSRASQALLLLSALALAASLLALARALTETTRQAQQLDALTGASGKPARPLVRTQPRDPQELARVQLVRKTARSLATPWAELLAALEATPSDVALLSVEPSAALHSVRLTAEASAPAQMLGYVRALQADKRLSQVILVSHQVQTLAPGTPLRFQVEGHWGTQP